MQNELHAAVLYLRLLRCPLVNCAIISNCLLSVTMLVNESQAINNWFIISSHVCNTITNGICILQVIPLRRDDDTAGARNECRSIPGGVFVIKYFQRLREVTRNYQRLPGITKDYRGLQGITEDYWDYPGITRDYQGLLEITGITRDYPGLPGITQRLLRITRDYLRDYLRLLKILPKITRYSHIL